MTPAGRHFGQTKEFVVRNGAIFCILICAGLLLGNTSADPDLFARLAVGRLFGELGYMPLTDPFAFSPKKSIWVDHEWLSGVLFHTIYELFSDGGLFIFKLLIMGVTVWILIGAQRLIDQPGWWPFCLSLILILDARYIWASTVRSQVFTYLFLAIYLYAFAAYVKNGGRKIFLLLPPVMLLWCNFHGGFVVGLGLHLVFLLLQVRRDFFFHLIIFLCTASATALNPYGFSIYWQYIFHAVTMPRPAISEWHPLSILGVSGAVAYSVIAVTLLALFSKRRPLFVYAFYFIGLFFALQHQRHLAIFYFIVLAFVSTPGWSLKSGGFWPKRYEHLREAAKGSFSFVMSIFALYFVFIIAKFLSALPRFNFGLSGYPVEAVDWLNKNAEGGNILVDFNNGSYVLWRLYPRFKVSLDGRYEELYPESTFKMVNDALNCESPEQLEALRDLNPDFIIASRLETCFEEQGFSQSFSGGQYAVYRRNLGL